MSLKQTWTPELEETSHLAQLPYVIEYSKGDKRLIVALLNNDPAQSRKQIKLLEQLEALKPDATLEQAEVQPTPIKLLAQLKRYGYTAEDVAYFEITDILNQFFGPRVHTQKTLEKETKRLITELNERKDYAKAGTFSTEAFKKWFETKTRQPFTVEKIKDGILVAPLGTKKTTYLQTLATRMDAIQDKFFLEHLAKALSDKQNKTVVVLRAGSKFITEGRILSNMMDSEPKILFQ